MIGRVTSPGTKRRTRKVMEPDESHILRVRTKDSPSLQPFLVFLHGARVAEVVGFVAALMLAYTWLYYPIAQGHDGDFLAMLSARENDAGYWDGRGVGYGPVFAIYDFAFRGVTDLVALRVMYALNLAMLSMAFVVVLRCFLPAPRTSEELLGAVFLWLCFYPTFQALRQNNVEITELLFLVLMLDALRRRRDGLAGVCLGIAGATKILPFVLLFYFIWRRRFLLVAASILTGVALLAIVMILHGETFSFLVTDWLSRTHSSFPSEYQNNQAVSGFIWRSFSQFDLSNRWTIEHPFVLNVSAAHKMTVSACCILLALVSAIILKRTGFWPPSTIDQRLQTVEIAIVLIVMLLLLPHNHTHYFVLVSWIYIAALREWPQPVGSTKHWVFGLLALSYVFLGMLHFWRLFDPFLHRLGPVTGVDLARLASLPFLGALAGLAALLILHGHLARELSRSYSKV